LYIVSYLIIILVVLHLLYRVCWSSVYLSLEAASFDDLVVVVIAIFALVVVGLNLTW